MFNSLKYFSNELETLRNDLEMICRWPEFDYSDKIVKAQMTNEVQHSIDRVEQIREEDFLTFIVYD